MNKPWQFIRHAIKINDYFWTYYNVMSPTDRDNFDLMLVQIKNPIAYQAGSGITRFRETIRYVVNQVKELHKIRD